jgi:hypothetical protein
MRVIVSFTSCSLMPGYRFLNSCVNTLRNEEKLASLTSSILDACWRVSVMGLHGLHKFIAQRLLKACTRSYRRLVEDNILIILLPVLFHDFYRCVHVFHYKRQNIVILLKKCSLPRLCLPTFCRVEPRPLSLWCGYGSLRKSPTTSV